MGDIFFLTPQRGSGLPKGWTKSLKKNKKKLTEALDKLVRPVLISFSPSVKTVDVSSLKRKSVKEKGKTR